MRLSGVLLLIALVLGGGFAATLWFEGEQGGGALVPSVVVVDAPQIDETALDALFNRFEALRRLDDTPRQGLFGPFDPGVVARLGERGHRVVAFALERVIGAELRVDDVWDAVVDEYPRPAGRRLSREAFAKVAAFVSAQNQTRPFLVAVALADHGQGNLGQLLEPVVNALDGLPTFRRSSVVVVGSETASGGRLVLRLDCGREPPGPSPDLSDLTDPRW